MRYNFNRRHRRTGHLFENRYKSILCEEDRYLLALIEESDRRLVNPKELKSGGRRRKVSQTRASITYRSVEEPGLSTAEVARHLGVSTSSITRAIAKLEKKKSNKLCNLGTNVPLIVHDLAIEKFRAALKLDPAHLNSLFPIGLIYRYNMGENKKALAVFEELLSKKPDPRIAKMAAEEVKKIRAESGS